MRRPRRVSHSVQASSLSRWSMTARFFFTSKEPGRFFWGSPAISPWIVTPTRVSGPNRAWRMSFHRAWRPVSRASWRSAPESFASRRSAPERSAPASAAFERSRS